jgi:hypothetical protein
MTFPAVHHDSAEMCDELRPNACDIGVGGERTGSGFKGSCPCVEGTSGPLMQAQTTIQSQQCQTDPPQLPRAMGTDADFTRPLEPAGPIRQSTTATPRTTMVAISMARA